MINIFKKKPIRNEKDALMNLRASNPNLSDRVVVKSEDLLNIIQEVEMLRDVVARQANVIQKCTPIIQEWLERRRNKQS